MQVHISLRMPAGPLQRSSGPIKMHVQSPTPAVSQAAGLAGDGPVTYDQLLPFDQHHYGGTAAVDAALAAVSSSLAAVDTVRPQPVCT